MDDRCGVDFELILISTSAAASGHTIENNVLVRLQTSFF